MPLLFVPIKSVDGAKLSEFEKSFVDWLNNCISTLNHFQSLKFDELDEIPEKLKIQTRERIKLVDWLTQEENQKKIKKSKNYSSHQKELDGVFNLPYLRFAYLEANEIATFHEMLSLIVAAYDNNKSQIHNQAIKDKINELREASSDCVDYMKASLALPVEESEKEEKAEKVQDLEISIYEIQNRPIKSRDPLTELIFPVLKDVLNISGDLKSDGDALFVQQTPNPMFEAKPQDNTSHYFAKAIAKTTKGVEWLQENEINYFSILIQPETKSLVEKSKALPHYATGLIFDWWHGRNKKTEKKPSIQNGMVDNAIEWLGDNYYIDRVTHQYFSKWSYGRYRDKLNKRKNEQQDKNNKLSEKYNLVKWRVLKEAIVKNNIGALKQWLQYQKDLETKIERFVFSDFLNREVNDLTLLHWAYALNRTEIIKVLREFGAKDIENQKNGTPEAYVKQLAENQWQFELMSLIEKKDINKLESFLKTHEGKSLNFCEPDGMTPLLSALHLGEPEIYQLLVKYKADTNYQGDLPYTAVNYASYQIELMRLVEAGDAKKVEDYLKLQPSTWSALKLDFENERGFTPLLVAAINGNKAVYDALCVAGADPEHYNRYGMKPEDYAEINFSLAQNEPEQESKSEEKRVEQPSLFGRCVQALAQVVSKVSPLASPSAEKKEVVEEKVEPKVVETKAEVKLDEIDYKKRTDALLTQNIKLRKEIEELVEERSLAKTNLINHKNIINATEIINDEEKNKLLDCIIEDDKSFDHIQLLINMLYQMDDCQKRLNDYVVAYSDNIKKQSLHQRLSFWVHGEGWHGSGGCERAAQHFSENKKIISDKINEIKTVFIPSKDFDPIKIMKAYKDGLQFIINQIEKYVDNEDGNNHQFSYKSYLLGYRKEIQNLIPAENVKEVKYSTLINGELTTIDKKDLPKEYQQVKEARENRRLDRLNNRINSTMARL